MDDKKYTTLKVSQLVKLLEDVDQDKEIRVWCEMNLPGSENIFLEGRRLIGVSEDPNDDFVCLTAVHYEVEK